MFFSVLGDVRRPFPPPGVTNSAFLSVDNWDDWGKYRTMFYLVVVDENGVSHDIGSVKIGQVGLRPAGQVQPGHRAPAIPNAFDSLDANFFQLVKAKTTTRP